MNQNYEPITEVLRRAMQSAPITVYAMSKRLGVRQSTLSRFVNRQRGLSLELLDRLGELLGLRLVVDPAHELPAGGESKLKTEATTKTKAKSSKAARKGR